MMETLPDRGQTWEQFHADRMRRIDEISIAYDSMPWWEQQEADRDLAQLWFEVRQAEAHIEVDPED